MRILLTGLPASGKTTLAAHLAMRTGVPVRSETATDLAVLGYDVGPTMTVETLATMLAVELSRDLSAESAVIADRGPVDFAAYGRLIMASAPTAAIRVVAQAITLVCRDWMQRLPYDLVVYHDEVCGDRGIALQLRDTAYLNNLREFFNRTLADFRLEFLRMPPTLTIEQRTDYVLSAL
jgi:predicted ATPase